MKLILTSLKLHFKRYLNSLSQPVSLNPLNNKNKHLASADSAIDNATLAIMLAELRADLLTKPDSLPQI